MTFLLEKSIKTSDSFCKTHNEMMIATATIHTCLEGEGFPGTIRDAKALMVGGGGRRRGHVVGYTSASGTRFLESK
jgi:hypothetical protein